MLVSSRIKLALGLWLVLEVLAFSLVAQLIGVPRTILLGVITSLLGLILLRRAGAAALMKLRASFDGRVVTERDKGHFMSEMLATAGALALLLPGFLSDAVGLALSVPVLRDRAAGWLKGRSPFGSRPGPTTIDLAPEEWTAGEGARPIAERSRSR